MTKAVKNMILLSACLIFLTTGCRSVTKQELGPEEFVSFVNNEPALHRASEVNGIKYETRLIPSQALAMRHRGDSVKTRPEMDSLLKCYYDRVNFTLLISDANEDVHVVKQTIFDAQRYNTIISYANAEMSNDFMLVQEGDTLYTSLLHIESSNSVKPVLRLSLGFEGVKPGASDLTLIFSDHIFESGFIKFNFPSSALRNLPEIKI